MDDGSGMVAIIRGMKDAELGLTVFDKSGKQYTLCPKPPTETCNPPVEAFKPAIEACKNCGTAVEQKKHPEPTIMQNHHVHHAHNMPNGFPHMNFTDPMMPCHSCPMGSRPMTRTQDVTTRTDPPQSHTATQAVDGRYVSTYQSTVCRMEPTSPVQLLTEFPPQRPYLHRGYGNFQVGGTGSGDTPHASVQIPSHYRSGRMFSDRGSVSPARLSVDSQDIFTRSLRKYPRVPVERSSEVIEQLINYTQAKNFGKLSHHSNFNQGNQTEPKAKSPSRHCSGGFDSRHLRIDESPTRDRPRRSSDFEANNSRNALYKSYDVRHLREVTKLLRENIRSNSASPIRHTSHSSSTHSPSREPRERHTERRLGTGKTGPNLVNTETQVAAEMVCREVSTSPRVFRERTVSPAFTSPQPIERFTRKINSIPKPPTVRSARDRNPRYSNHHRRKVKEVGSRRCLRRFSIDGSSRTRLLKELTRLPQVKMNTPITEEDTVIKGTASKLIHTPFDPVFVKTQVTTSYTLVSNNKPTLGLQNCKSETEISRRYKERKKCLEKFSEMYPKSSTTKDNQHYTEDTSNSCNTSPWFQKHLELCHKCNRLNFPKEISCTQVYSSLSSPRMSPEDHKKIAVRSWLSEIPLKSYDYLGRPIKREEIINCIVRRLNVTPSSIDQVTKTEVLDIVDDIPFDIPACNKFNFIQKVTKDLIYKLESVSHNLYLHTLNKESVDKNTINSANDPRRFVKALNKEIKDFIQAQIQDSIDKSLLEIGPTIKSDIEKKLTMILCHFLEGKTINGQIVKNKAISTIEDNSRLLNFQATNFANELIKQFKGTLWQSTYDKSVESFLNPFPFKNPTKFADLITANNGTNINSHDDESLFVETYKLQLHKKVDDWLTIIQTEIPQVGNYISRKNIIKHLVEDIVDRRQYLEMSFSKPATEKDEIEHLRYQIFKEMNKLMGVNYLQVLKKASELMQMIRTVPAPAYEKFGKHCNQKINLLPTSEHLKQDLYTTQNELITHIVPTANLANMPEISESIGTNVTYTTGTSTENRFDEFLREWVSNVPVLLSNAEDLNSKREALLKDIWKILAKLKSSPLIRNYPALYEEALDEEIDNLLKFICPQTTEYLSKKRTMKSQLIAEAKIMNESAKTNPRQDSFRDNVKSKIDAEVATIQCEHRMEDSMRYYKELKTGLLADQYLLYCKYREEDPMRAEAHRLQFLRYAKDFVRELKAAYDQELKDIDEEAYISNIVQAVERIRIPSQNAIQQEADKLLLGYEIDSWLSDIPICYNDDPQEQLKRRRLRDNLAENLYKLEGDIEKGNKSSENEALHEISLVLDKLPFVRDANLKTSFMAKELANRMKNRQRAQNLRYQSLELDKDVDYDKLSQDMDNMSTFIEPPIRNLSVGTRKAHENPEIQNAQSVTSPMLEDEIQNQQETEASTSRDVPESYLVFSTQQHSQESRICDPFAAAREKLVTLKDSIPMSRLVYRHEATRPERRDTNSPERVEHTLPDINTFEPPAFSTNTPKNQDEQNNKNKMRKSMPVAFGSGNESCCVLPKSSCCILILPPCCEKPNVTRGGSLGAALLRNTESKSTPQERGTQYITRVAVETQFPPEKRSKGTIIREDNMSPEIDSQERMSSRPITERQRYRPQSEIILQSRMYRTSVPSGIWGGAEPEMQKSMQSSNQPQVKDNNNDKETSVQYFTLEEITNPLPGTPPLEEGSLGPSIREDNLKGTDSQGVMSSSPVMEHQRRTRSIVIVQSSIYRQNFNQPDPRHTSKVSEPTEYESFIRDLSLTSSRNDIAVEPPTPQHSPRYYKSTDPKGVEIFIERNRKSTSSVQSSYVQPDDDDDAKNKSDWASLFPGSQQEPTTHSKDVKKAQISPGHSAKTESDRVSLFPGSGQEPTTHTKNDKKAQISPGPSAKNESDWASLFPGSQQEPITHSKNDKKEQISPGHSAKTESDWSLMFPGLQQKPITHSKNDKKAQSSPGHSAKTESDWSRMFPGLQQESTTPGNNDKKAHISPGHSAKTESDWASLFSDSPRPQQEPTTHSKNDKNAQISPGRRQHAPTSKEFPQSFSNQQASSSLPPGSQQPAKTESEWASLFLDPQQEPTTNSKNDKKAQISPGHRQHAPTSKEFPQRFSNQQASSSLPPGSQQPAKTESEWASLFLDPQQEPTTNSENDKKTQISPGHRQHAPTSKEYPQSSAHPDNLGIFNQTPIPHRPQRAQNEEVSIKPVDPRMQGPALSQGPGDRAQRAQNGDVSVKPVDPRMQGPAFSQEGPGLCCPDPGCPLRTYEQQHGEARPNSTPVDGNYQQCPSRIPRGTQLPRRLDLEDIGFLENEMNYCRCFQKMRKLKRRLGFCSCTLALFGSPYHWYY